MLSPPIPGQDHLHPSNRPTYATRATQGESMGCGASVPMEQGAPVDPKQQNQATPVYQMLQQQADAGVNLVQVFQQRISHRKWSIRDPSEWTQLDVEAWFESWQVRPNLDVVKQLNGARLLAMREPKDVSVITTDADAQTVLLKRLRELRKISRHIKRQQQQLQQMLAQGLKDLRMSNANARAAAAAKRDTSTSGNGELVATESMPPKAPTGAGPKPEASGTGGGSSGTGQGAAHSAAAGGQHLDASSLAVAGGGSQNVDTPGAGIGGVRSARGGEDVVVDRGRAISTGEAAGPSDGGASAGNSHAHGQGPHRLANMTSDSADLRPAPKTHGALEGQGARKRDTWAMGMGPGKEGTRGDNVLVNGGMAAGHGDQTQAAEIYSGAQ